jgi:hypothetical protein
MAEDLIRYDLLVQEAMRDVMRKVMADVATNGLPGDHHFTISFLTGAPNVRISKRLAEQWPTEMTIILQHQFAGLFVDEGGFGVTLSFRSVSEKLYIPFAAVTGFFDPSVEFGLKFEAMDGAEAEEDEASSAAPTRPGPTLVRPDQPHQIAPAAAKLAPAEVLAPTTPSEETAQNDEPASAAKIVSIDAFRKKH